MWEIVEVQRLDFKHCVMQIIERQVEILIIQLLVI